ncbi:hypothetical protein HHK36_028321 [Tetracentron sinense]|uniref:No apical meristem-associated C-terminal domain-containing protein n=1 Tax=Tetracentron sinense TaxID=13715 RepID=A0A835D1Z1_TETSI|nr:hypothetical protein HHK36_028321 [Tetracentron sinense]
MLWGRISENFESHKRDCGQAPQTPKSLQCRIGLIPKAINKFRRCIRQVENLNPSDASELDIFEYFEGSQTRTPISRSPETPSTVDLNADEDEQTPIEVCADSSGQPMGRKKEKMRKRLAADKSALIAGMFQENHAILETFKRGEIKRNERLAQMDNDATIRYNVMMLQAENKRNKLQLRREKQEREFMEKDLNSISDPIEREYFRDKKLEIVEKGARDSQVGGSSATFNHDDFNSFSQYQGGYEGNDLPPY